MSFSHRDSAGCPVSGSTVVLVHGALVNGWEMGILRARLARAGYAVRQFHYQSMLRGFDENVARLRHFIAGTEGSVVHVVGHSMGGVLTRRVFEQTPDPRPGRLIALGSPLTGCWVGKRVSRLHPHVGPWLTGRTVRDYLAQTPDPAWRGSRDFGVVAGTVSLGIGRLFHSLPRPNDGVVLLEETRLQGLSDHATCCLTHFGLLLSRRCCAQVVQFLETGRFHDHK